MEFLTLILATVLAVALYLWMMQWRQGCLCVPKLPIVTSPLCQDTENLTTLQHLAPSERREIIPEVKWSTLRVSLKYLDGEEHGRVSTSTLHPDDTVAEAKQKLSVEGRRLVFAGKPLDDAKTLEDCGVKDGAALYTTPPETVAFQVRSITGRTLALRCDAQDRVATLRSKVKAVLGVEGRQLALVLRGQELKSSSTLRESDLRDGDVVHLVMRFRGGEDRIFAQCAPEEAWGGDVVAASIQSGSSAHGEAWGDAVVEKAMRALYLADIRRHVTRGENSNVEGIVHERNVLEGFRFEMAQSTIVVVILVLGEPYLLQLERSWSADQAKDVLQRALGISVPQEVKFYFCEKELKDYYGLRDGDFLELC